MNDEQRMELVRKVGLFGLKDLRKLAPIGDLGYLNVISYYRGSFLMSGLPQAIMDAFHEQKKKYGWTVESGNTVWRCTDHWSRCPELGFSWRLIVLWL